MSAFANKLHNRAFRLFPGYSPTLTTGHFVQLVGFLERGRLRSDPHFNSQTELTLIDPAKYVWLTAGEQREATEVVLEFLGLGELIGKVSIPHLKSTDPAFLKIIKLELTPQIVRRIQDLYRNDFELLFPDLLPLNRDSG